MKNGEIIFSKETLQALYAFARFLECERAWEGSREDVEADMNAFKRYIETNKLESGSIMKCNCKHAISNREIIFNVCLTCEGVVSKDWRGSNL